MQKPGLHWFFVVSQLWLKFSRGERVSVGPDKDTAVADERMASLIFRNAAKLGGSITI